MDNTTKQRTTNIAQHPKSCSLGLIRQQEKELSQWLRGYISALEEHNNWFNRLVYFIDYKIKINKQWLREINSND